VFDDPLLESRAFGAPCVNFMFGCIEDLESSLTELGLPLQWRRGKQVEEARILPVGTVRLSVVDHRQAREEYLALGKALVTK
jgi:hypothetical protein